MAFEHNLPEELILGRSQEQYIVQARHEVWRRLRGMNYTVSDIGRLFGRNHATVISALKEGGKNREIPFPDLSGEWAI